MNAEKIKINETLYKELESSLGFKDKFVVFMIVGLNKKASNEEIEKNLPAGYRLAGEHALRTYSESYGPQTRGILIALGSTGPHPYMGNPGINADNEICSYGISIDEHLQWHPGTFFLLLRNDVETTNKEEIYKILLDANARSWRADSTIEAVIEEDGTEKTVYFNGGKCANGNIYCVHRYKNADSSLSGWADGPIPIASFKKIIV